MSSVNDKRKPATETSAAISIRAYTSVTDNIGKAVELPDWPAFVAYLGTRLGETAPSKKALPLIGPHTLRAGGKRDLPGVESITLGALDLDTDIHDVDAVLEVISAWGWAAVVHTSPRDPQPETRKLRAYFPLSRPLAPHECGPLRKVIADSLGVIVDPNTLDASRFLFVGAIKGTPARELWEIEGEPLPVDDLLAIELVPEPSAERKAKPAPSVPRGEPADDDDPVVALVRHEWETGARHPINRALASKLAQLGWDDIRIAGIFRALGCDREGCGPEHRVREAIKAAHQAREFHGHGRGEEPPGWMKLCERFGVEGAQAIKDAAKDPRMPDGFVGVWSEAEARRQEMHAKWAENWAKRAARKQAEAKEAANDTCPPGTPGTEPPPPDPSEDDWDAPEVPIDWYCEKLGIAPSERKVTLLAGMPGSGKGPLAGHLAISFALGLPALGAFPCKQCNVGILDYEGRRLTMRRIRAIARGLKRDPKELKGRVFVRDCDPGTPSDLREWIAARNIEVLIVDSYMTAMSANEADPNSPAYAQLAQELGALGIVVIVVAHTRKLPAGKTGESLSLGDVAGSYALAGMAATAISVWNPDDDDKMLVRVKCLRAPDEAFLTFDVRWDKDQGAPADAQAWTGRMVGAAGKQAQAEAKEQKAKQYHDENLTRSAQALISFMARNHHMGHSATALRDSDVHERDIRTVLAALLEAGHVEHQPDYSGRSKGTWRLVVDAAGKPPLVVFSDGKAMPDPDQREVRNAKFGFRKPKPKPAAAG